MEQGQKLALKVTHEFGKCDHHRRRWAVVKLQGNPVCLECFNRQMARLGDVLRPFKVGVTAANAGSISIRVVHPDA